MRIRLMAVTVLGLLLFSCSSSKNYRFMGQTHIEDDRYFAIANVSETNSCFMGDQDIEDLIKAFDEDPNYSLENHTRPVVHRNVMAILNNSYFENQEGTQMVFKVSIDSAGNPVMAEYLAESTALVKDSQKTKILEAVMGYKYEANPASPCIETGKLTIVLQKIAALTNY